MRSSVVLTHPLDHAQIRVSIPDGHPRVRGDPDSAP
jgi:hypothetical protein